MTGIDCFVKYDIMLAGTKKLIIGPTLYINKMFLKFTILCIIFRVFSW